MGCLQNRKEIQPRSPWAPTVGCLQVARVSELPVRQRGQCLQEALLVSSFGKGSDHPDYSQI